MSPFNRLHTTSYSHSSNYNARVQLPVNCQLCEQEQSCDNANVAGKLIIALAIH